MYALPLLATFLAIEQKPMEEVNWPMRGRVGYKKRAKLTFDCLEAGRRDYNCWSIAKSVGLGWCESEGEREDEARPAKESAAPGSV